MPTNFNNIYFTGQNGGGLPFKELSFIYDNDVSGYRVLQSNDFAKLEDVTITGSFAVDATVSNKLLSGISGAVLTGVSAQLVTLNSNVSTLSNQLFTNALLSGISGIATSSGLFVQGPTSISGSTFYNPVLIGGRVQSTPPTFANNQLADLQLDTRGNIKTAIYNQGGSQGASVKSVADNMSTDAGVTTVSQIVGYNGTKLDMVRVATGYKPQDGVSIGTEATIWTPLAGRKFRVMGYHLYSDPAGKIMLRDMRAGYTPGAATGSAGIITIVPSGSNTFVNFGQGYLASGANNVLTASGITNALLYGVVFGTEE